MGAGKERSVPEEPDLLGEVNSFVKRIDRDGSSSESSMSARTFEIGRDLSPSFIWLSVVDT